ncbi:zinc-dependent alcohol dehydrogenase family protein [Kribbella sp. NBC_01245]|uniref:zinc-dependent alcohol dehydrogenase family protein n=1 Tax=Kribbella sp. NBC_01245 TaxID=2903578 RepID=UPI002E280298|nr:zinc-dependent alcohol dehydrogenase family protein [Kribbella sp. NBC_01245]
MSERMAAWAVERPGPIDGRPLRLVQRAVPEAGAGEVLVSVLACGVCRTDLHLCEGDLAPRRPGVVPGHQVVGEVVALGPGAERFALGERVGIAWLRGTCGSCEFCRRGAENLCPRSTYTGWDADGGFAEYAVVPQDYAYRLPGDQAPEALAPLLCAGIIGYRALVRSNLPPGGRLGLYGFGSSAHLTAQLAAAQGAEVYVMTRGEANQRLARELAVAYVGAAQDTPPVQLDSAIVFAPAGELVPLALQALKPGGTVAVAGIHLSDVPTLNYDRDLFRERDLRSVTANTRSDGENLFRLTSRLPVVAHTTVVPFGQVDRALADLAHGRASGSLVATRVS